MTTLDLGARKIRVARYLALRKQLGADAHRYIALKVTSQGGQDRELAVAAQQLAGVCDEFAPMLKEDSQFRIALVALKLMAREAAAGDPR